MSEALATYTAGSIEKVWSNPAEIKALAAPQLTDGEFSYFMGLSKATGMNPLMREIWAVKYGNSAAQIFIGRDGYRRKAQELPEYEGHTASAIYENDKFEVDNGIPHHWFGIQNRGQVIGAYCVVYVKGRKVPFLEVVDVKEYNTGKSNWAKMPATMIKKVAEAQALRGAFQGTFGGTYEESEQWDDTQKPIDVNPQQRTKAQQIESLYSAIDTLTEDRHYKHVEASLSKWLHVADLRSVTEVKKLYDYFCHVRDEMAEEIKVESLRANFMSNCDAKDFNNAMLFYRNAKDTESAIPEKELAGMRETVTEYRSDLLEAFDESVIAKEWDFCQSIFDEAIGSTPIE